MSPPPPLPFPRFLGFERGSWGEIDPLPPATRARASIEHLRDLKAFFGTTFKIKEATASRLGELTDGADDEALGGKELAVGGKEDEAEEYILSCVGTGFVNTAKRAG